MKLQEAKLEVLSNPQQLLKPFERPESLKKLSYKNHNQSLNCLPLILNMG